MIGAAALLGLLAVALAWPVPVFLASASWPSRSPATALVLWQAIALAGALSMIGALLMFGLAPFGDNLVHGLQAFLGSLGDGTLPPGAHFIQLFALSAALLLGLHLALNLAATVYTAERSRRRHRELVALLSSPYPEQPRTRLLDYDAPVAYCLPGTVRSMTVLSAGLIQLLTPEQLRAVIEHERAHATQRHDLVLIAFRAWRAALPWFPVANLAGEAVATLVELLADDRARRVVSDRDLADAIRLVRDGLSAGDATIGASEFEAEGPASAVRIARLDGRVLPLEPWVSALVVAFAAALLAVPTTLLLLPAL
ncbi:M56 family metallopeptidase [Cryobacterium sp. BB736]|uniref:M56 family metallopeptidase n=1 Tax=Cryobacterium sp. BB736 TaxID=2746963 RepID=UPI001876F09B